MTVRDKDTLRGLFESGDQPTGENFADLIDSYLSVSPGSTQQEVQTCVAFADIKSDEIILRNGTTEHGRIRYNASAAATVFEGWNGSEWVEGIRVGNDGNLGFFSSTGSDKPTISGYRSDDPATEDLLTSLATVGLITDDTTVASGVTNVLWEGAVGDGVTNDTTAIQAALDSAAEVYLPEGTYSVTSLVLSKPVKFTGAGRDKSIVNITSYGTYQDIKYGVLICGASVSAKLNDTAVVSGLKFNITSTAAGQDGILITKRTLMDKCYVRGAPDDGIYLRSVDPEAEAPYFSRFTDVWSKSNDGNGVRVTENCNNVAFYNCEFDANGNVGLYVYNAGNGQPIGLVGTQVYGGQASYNQKEGIYLRSGGYHTVSNCYAEYNSQATGGSPHAEGAYKNIQLGSAAANCNVIVGSMGEPEADVDACLGLNNVFYNTVTVGNRHLTPIRMTSGKFQLKAIAAVSAYTNAIFVDSADNILKFKTIASSIKALHS